MRAEIFTEEMQTALPKAGFSVSETNAIINVCARMPEVANLRYDRKLFDVPAILTLIGRTYGVSDPKAALNADPRKFLKVHTATPVAPPKNPVAAPPVPVVKKTEESAPLTEEKNLKRKRQKFSKTLNFEDVKDSIQETFKATGQRPMVADGPIVHGRLKDQGWLWKHVNKAFNMGVFGDLSTERIIVDSLGSYLDSIGMKNALNKSVILPPRKNRTSKKPEILLSDIKAAALHHMRKHGRRPTQLSGRIEDELFPKKGMSWHSLSMQIARKGKWIEENNYISLPNCLDGLEVFLISPASVADSFRETFRKTARVPDIHDIVQHGSLKYLLLWHSVHKAIQKKQQGFRNLPYKDLRDFCSIVELPARKSSIPPERLTEGFTTSAQGSDQGEGGHIVSPPKATPPARRFDPS